MAEDPTEARLLYKLEARPPILGAAFVGFQHLLAMFGGILTAPLLVALGMGLDAWDTTYLISAALVVSGFATLVQINRISLLGTGLLSVQGTSFAFIGPLVFSYEKLVLNMSSDEALGVIFGSSALCALVVMGLSVFIRHLKDIITTNVAGATIILLGLSLVHATLQGLEREFTAAGGLAGDGLSLMLLAALVFAVIMVLASQHRAWLRLSSITMGLGVGIVASMLMGVADFSNLSDVPLFFVPEIRRYPLGIDLQIVAIILPIYLVSAVESVGDITATTNLSGLPTEGHDYWVRMRGGIMAGAFSSVVASLVSTFPSTTFSQNNGVIRLTGVASRHVGKYVAVFLIMLGLLPVIAALFQAIPVVV
nr:xanthine permease XanP [Pseudomonadales bacterium]